MNRKVEGHKSVSAVKKQQFVVMLSSDRAKSIFPPHHTKHNRLIKC